MIVRLNKDLASVSQAHNNRLKEVNERLSRIKANANMQHDRVIDFENSNRGEEDAIDLFGMYEIETIEVVSTDENKNFLINYIKFPDCEILSEYIRTDYRWTCDISGQGIKIFNFQRMYDFFAHCMKNDLHMYRSKGAFIYKITSREAYYWYQLFMTIFGLAVLVIVNMDLQLIGGTRIEKFENFETFIPVLILNIIVIILGLFVVLTNLLMRFQVTK